MIFQQDGVFLNYTIPVRQYLDHRLSNMCMRQAGPILRPARFPDLTNVTSFSGDISKSKFSSSYPRIFLIRRHIFVKLMRVLPKTHQKGFKKLENRISFVARQKWGSIWNFTNLVKTYNSKIKNLCKSISNLLVLTEIRIFQISTFSTLFRREIFT